MLPIIAALLPRDWIALPLLKEDDTVVVDAVVFENVDESSHDASLVATTSELAATNHQSTPHHQRTPQTADAS